MWLPKGVLFFVLAVTGSAGCGGSSPSVAPAPGSSVADFTAMVNVNVSTGAVTFTPSALATKTSRTVFTGPTMSMSSSILLNQAGSPGVKTTSVTLTNNSTLPIGVDSNGNAMGVKVLFGAFTITGGSSTNPVTLSDPTGLFPSPGATDVPYILYPAQIAPNKASPAQNWNFVVPSGVTAFSVPVTIEADNSYFAPPNGVSGAGSPSVYVRTIAGGLAAGYSNGTGIQSRFDTFGGCAIDGAGNLYVVDSQNNTIRRISSAGVVSLVAGSAFASPSLTNGPGNLARFFVPEGIAVTRDGSTLYVADAADNAVRRIALTGTDPTNAADWSVTTIAGTGTQGGNYSSPVLGSIATFDQPYGIAVDSGGNVDFTEIAGNRVRRLTYTGGDPSNGANWEVTLLGGDSSKISGSSGHADGFQNGSTFNLPRGIGMDLDGNCYVADYLNCRIRKITADGNSSTIAGGTSASAVTFGYLDGAGPSAEFEGPYDIAVDSSGSIYVTDVLTARVREISQTGFVTTIAGTGNTTSSDGPGNTAGFTDPAGIAVSASGTLYVVDFSEIRAIERINSQ